LNHHLLFVAEDLRSFRSLLFKKYVCNGCVFLRLNNPAHPSSPLWNERTFGLKFFHFIATLSFKFMGWPWTPHPELNGTRGIESAAAKEIIFCWKRSL